MNKPVDKVKTNTAANSENTTHAIGWARATAQCIEDVAKGILSFIPNGLALNYDMIFKKMPLIGHFFAHPWVEQVIKLCSGVTIGQGLAVDIAKWIFWPIGFALGALISSFVSKKKAPVYHKQASKFLYQLSGQTIAGALLAGLAVIIAFQHFPQIFAPYMTLQNVITAIGCGAVLGMLGKALFIFAKNSVNNANNAAIRRNVQRAKELNVKLKAASKQKAKSRILSQAQDIIQQMNGAHSQHFLEDFLKAEYDTISASFYIKIDRHFNYLTDRACCGDEKALKRLQSLLPSGSEYKKDSLDKVLDRLFNLRAITKLKDDMDTSYDRWYYQFLCKKIA